MWWLFALGSAVFAALTSILAKIGIEGVNSNLATAIRTVVVVIMAWGMVFLTHAQDGLSGISRRSWLFLILSGLATFVAVLLPGAAAGRGIEGRAHRQAVGAHYAGPGVSLPARAVHREIAGGLPADRGRDAGDGAVMAPWDKGHERAKYTECRESTGVPGVA